MKERLNSFKIGSQNQKILDHLLLGKSLTCLEAVIYGFSHNLRSRIADIKNQGFNIKSEKITVPNGYIAKYSLIGVKDV